MQRVSVRGTSGSGKTTTSRRLAERLGVPHIELDALHHEPNWTEATAEVLKARVDDAMNDAPDGWVIDGNYDGKLGDLVLGRADTVVWLDLPLRVCLGRLWRRTWRRIIRREELWSGNRESVRGAFFMKDSLFAWTIKTHRRRAREWPTRFERHPQLHVLRLRSAAEVDRFLMQIPLNRSTANPTRAGS